jgi:hypothetical protein
MPDWTMLSVRGTAILQTVATSASQGYSTVEIARGLGTSKRWVFDRLGELRAELEQLSGD